MKIISTIFFALTIIASYGQYSHRDTTWIPFKIKLLDNKDTLTTGFDFYLTKDKKTYIPSINDSLKCFQFLNVDSLVDFNLNYKNKNYKFKNIETVRLMYDHLWKVRLNPLSADTCYEIIADQAGCFVNVYISPYPIPKCDNKNHISVTSFLPVISGTVTWSWSKGHIAFKKTFGENGSTLKEEYWDKDGNIIDKQQFDKLWRKHK